MDAGELARRFGLDGTARLSDGPVARGKQGLVWRLATADGDWAVKVPLYSSSEEDVRLSTAFQEAAYDAGVPTPRVRRTAEGSVFATVDGRRVRMYEWVDVRAPDPRLDPALVGAVVAAIHRVSAAESCGPCDPWYHEAVGADRCVTRQRDSRVTRAGRHKSRGAWAAARLSELEAERERVGPTLRRAHSAV